MARINQDRPRQNCALRRKTLIGALLARWEGFRGLQGRAAEQAGAGSTTVEPSGAGGEEEGGRGDERGGGADCP